ncbi:MAG TPA: GDSL-type esterase/lipase family protein [Mycobacteriales bacterium]|nr:GDSL-type esterase/lipase family protein [Mycobacteriales bacterium]
MGTQTWRSRRARTWAGRSAYVLVLALAALTLALAVTPKASVSVFGQSVKVGAVAPSIHLGLSGPGEADLFGEGIVETVQHFDGPIRPLIVWQRFNRNDDAAAFIQSGSDGGRRTVATGSAEVGRSLAAGWTRYFGWLVAAAGLLGGALYLVSVGLRALAGGEHRSRVTHLRFLAASVVAATVVTLGFTALTVRTAVDQLGSVTSLSDLVGTANLIPVPAPVGPKRTDAEVVVIGDSTAAGIGNAPPERPTKQDTACQRSSDAYAFPLQAISHVSTLNLACSSATVANGLLGPQTAGGMTIPPQVGVLQSVQSASVVVVSVGANDVGWSDFLRYCYGLPRCDDEASDRLFQSRLDAFKIQYAQLLQQLSDLPAHPRVIVTKYYDPFGSTFDCPQLQDPAATAGAPPGYGFGPDPGKDNQDQKIKQKIEPLRVELERMNTVLEQGAQGFGFSVVSPGFEGHELCTDESWVQGMADPAPFHPRAAGELAIAAAILPQLPG